MDISITIPPEAFARDIQDSTSEKKLRRLQMIGYRKSQLFIPTGSAYSESFIEHQPVISAIVTGKQVFNLSSPVVYRVRNLQVRENWVACYLNFCFNSNSQTDGETVTLGPPCLPPPHSPPPRKLSLSDEAILPRIVTMFSRTLLLVCGQIVLFYCYRHIQ